MNRNSLLKLLLVQIPFVFVEYCLFELGSRSKSQFFDSGEGSLKIKISARAGLQENSEGSASRNPPCLSLEPARKIVDEDCVSTDFKRQNDCFAFSGAQPPSELGFT